MTPFVLAIKRIADAETTIKKQADLIAELEQSFNRKHAELDNHIYGLEQTIDMLKKDIAALQYEQGNK